ncbi:hypothetical protein ACFVUQ_24600 [Streptomyces cyaneofuscatus]|uniref:hypothetical protein n=1 Tax=Streptomyces cyaneofuscatus TaxID=66883 RepID=UPI0036DB8985
MDSPARGRRALCIGLETNDHESGSPDPRGASRHLTGERVRDLADALTGAGYGCATRLDVPGRWVADEVLDFLERRRSDDLCVIYVTGHGTPGSLRPDAHGTPEGGWLDHVLSAGPLDSSDAFRPPVLLLIDTCHAPGTTSRWHPRHLPPRTWLILGTGGRHDPGPVGTLGRRIASTLRRLGDGALDVDPALPAVPLHMLASEVRREAVYDAGEKVIVLGPSDRGSPEDETPPFFPNPAYLGGRRRSRLSRTTAPGVLPFLEDADGGLDHQHFMERASGTSAVAEHGRGVLGRFTGRRRELAALSDWLDDPEARGPAVVTGAPGAGKSALLGVLVCAAHPELREASRDLWQRAHPTPLPVGTGFAAVHARQRGLSEICASLARQLDVTAHNPRQFLKAAKGMSVQPVIVVDALDEMPKGIDVMNQLLMPLSLEGRDDGRSLARVLVATRDYPEFGRLIDAAAGGGLLVDLDCVPPDELAADVAEYVTGILRTTRGFRHRGSVVHTFARALAATLVDRGSPQSAWGAFLVAGLWARTLVNSGFDTAITADEAAEAAHRVPRSLTELLELELRSQPELFWLRPVLTALGTAHGQGMPASVLRRIAPLFAGDHGPLPSAPSSATVKETLGAARFYLRTVTDTNGALLYRLFHQSIANHLVDDFEQSGRIPNWRQALLDRLFAPLGSPPARNWDAAEPYVLRHVMGLAREAGREQELFDDAEFLIRADPGSLDGLRSACSGSLGLPPRVLEQLLDRRSPLRERRMAASLTALRTGDAELAHRLAAPVHGAPLPWIPWWTTPLSPPPDRIVALPSDHRTELFVLDTGSGRHGVLEGQTGRTAEPEGPDLPDLVDAERISLAGHAVALVTDGTGHQWIHQPGTPRLIDAGRSAASWRPSGPGSLPSGPGPAGPSARALFDGRLVVCLGTRDGSVIVEDALDGHRIVGREGAHNGPVTALVARYDASGLSVLSGGADGSVWSWRPGRDRGERVLLLDDPVRALDITADDELFVSSGQGLSAFRGGLPAAEGRTGKG